MKASNSAQRAPLIVGPGRVGRSLHAALNRVGTDAEIRGRDWRSLDLNGRNVLLCVPDQAIGELAEEIGSSGSTPALIGHSSGASTLDLLASSGAEGCFSLHPLQTVPDGATDLTGCPAAVAGSNAEALQFSVGLALVAGMRPFEISESDRAVYHAAASIASNYLVTIEQTAADLLGGIQVDDPRSILEPLVRNSLENWLARGAEALTGPIARGDETTVASHREALSSSRPELIDLYDALAQQTRRIAAERESA